MQSIFLALSSLAIISNAPDFSVQDLINNKQLSPIVRDEIADKLILDLSKKNLTSLNGLQNIPHKEFLEVLDLSFNKIKRLPPDIFQGFDNLELLALNDNQLSELPAESFTNLTELKVLFLEDNKKLCLFPEIFQVLISLKSICLNNEQLKKLNQEIFQELTNRGIIVVLIT